MHAQTIGHGSWNERGAVAQTVPFEPVFSPFNALAEGIVSGVDAAARAAATLVEAARREYRVRRAIRSLSELDNRTLNDIGISRGDIPYVARYGRERRVYNGSS